MKERRGLGTWVLILFAGALSLGTETTDIPMTLKFREEGLRRSQVMAIAWSMTDLLGPRLSNSPGYAAACRWAVGKFTQYGIQAELQEYGKVGSGWENEYTSVHMHEPRYMPFIAYTKPYSRSTAGKVIGEAVLINTDELYEEDDLLKYRGRLKGKIVCLKPERRLTLNFQPPASRLSQEELDDMAELRILDPQPGRQAQEDDPSNRNPRARKDPLPEKTWRAFFDQEGVGALMEPGGPQGNAPMDKGLVLVDAPRPPRPGDPRPLPTVVVSVEQYNRVVRLLEKGISVQLEVETRVRWEESDWPDFNVIAELPGGDLKDEIVMIGGHYDSELSGTGATDNAAGCAAVVEAMRILKTVGARPRRTIRAALWGGEEAGHLGSRAYVKKHFGDPETPARLPEHGRLSVYFNMDWYGRFRGIYLQGNDLARPIFEEWMKPFHDLGMTYLAPGNTGGTDHMSFVAVGLPGFQFIQDDLEFFTTTFHTNMDVYDRLVPEDLMQAAVILASFAYNAATRDEMIPRTPNQKENDRRWHK